MHWRLRARPRAASEPLLYTLLGRTAAERRPGPTPRAQLAHVGLPAPLPLEGAHLFLTAVPTSDSFPLPCSQSPGRTARKKPSGGTTVPKYTAGSGAGVLHAAGTPGVCSGTVPWGQRACQAKPPCRRQQIQAGQGRQPPSPPASRLPAQLAAADRSLPFSAEGGGSCCGFLHPQTPLLLSGSLL